MQAKTVRLALGSLLLLALLSVFYAGSAQTLASSVLLGRTPRAMSAEEQMQIMVEQLQQGTDDQTRVSYHAGTGKVRFVGTDFDHAIAQPDMMKADATPEQAARQFLASYGSLFGLSDQSQELVVMREKTADRGRSFVRFQQVYKGIPVLGGELIVQVGKNKGIVSANGEVLPDLALDTTPRLGAGEARDQALSLVAKQYDLDIGELVVTEPELWIYNPILLKAGLNLDHLVWRMEVTTKELLPIDELVLVDAHLGAVVLHFNQIDTARNRLVYDNNNNRSAGLPGTGPVCTEGSCPGSGNDYNYAYDYAGDTYDFYNTYHGRDSIDNAGMTLISTVRYCPADPGEDCPYPNAFWNGTQMVYGEGFAVADDVVAHEMTHGVTSYESSLFYYMQSGAVNEAFSDMWGEFVDLTNGAGDDSPSVRWLMGEEIGAIRSMSNPPAYSLPDKMTSAYYYCGEGDRGGVHTNMGVGSKAAYLMVDGDTFNSVTVTGIGIEKTAKIWYEVQTNLFTSASDYQDLYDGLQQACANLVGTSGITAADCQQVKNAADATEMDQQPTSCPATEAPAPACPPGQLVANLFFDDMENTSSGNWTHGALTGADEWYYPQTANPYSFDATYATSGQYNLWGYNQSSIADFYMAMTSDVSLPAVGTYYMHFNHAYAFEDYETTLYDGGVLEYSTSGGGSWSDAGSLFLANGYDGTIYTGYGNPLAGRQAFAGESNGYFSSLLNLSSLAGQNVRFRFRIGTDNEATALGWFIDDVSIYTCVAASDFIHLPLVLKGVSSSSSTPTYTPTPTPTTGPSGWVTILDEDFEGTFPGSTWEVRDNDSDSGYYYWGKRDCRPNGGSYSAWSVGAGDSVLSCGSNYPNDVYAWMIFGPFSLADATDVEFTFDWWSETELDYDGFFYGASIDGSDYYGTSFTGDWSSWTADEFDLTNVYTLGNLLGEDQVWIAFVFGSDFSYTYRGSFVDNVLLRKEVGGAALGWSERPLATPHPLQPGQGMELTSIRLDR